MRTYRMKYTALGLAAIAGTSAAFALSQPALRAIADDIEEGRIVDIGAQEEEEESAVEAEEQAAVPAYWIGIQGAPIDSALLRTHLQLADDLGLAVAEVLPGSPAEKAGIRQQDILIGVGDEQVNDMSVLQKAVAEAKDKPIKLKIIRLAKEMTVEVTPEKTPKEFAEAAAAANRPRQLQGQLGQLGLPENLLEQLQGQGFPNARVIGPGMIMRGQALGGVGALPNGVSVRVTREGDNPAEITVSKGGKTWTVKSDDEEAIGKLPEDIQGLVRGAAGQMGGGPIRLKLNLDGQLNDLLPGQLGGLENHEERFNAQRQEMMKRMEEMEKRMQEFQRRLERENSGENSDPADPNTT